MLLSLTLLTDVSLVAAGLILLAGALHYGLRTLVTYVRDHDDT